MPAKHTGHAAAATFSAPIPFYPVPTHLPRNHFYFGHSAQARGRTGQRTTKTAVACLPGAGVQCLYVRCVKRGCTLSASACAVRPRHSAPRRDGDAAVRMFRSMKAVLRIGAWHPGLGP